MIPNDEQQLPPLPETAADDTTINEAELSAFDEVPLENAGTFVRAFSFRGRITRGEYTLSIFAGFVCLLILLNWATFCSFISSLFLGGAEAGGVFTRIAWAGWFCLAWFFAAQGVKRCHDVGHCGWFFYIPFYGIALFFLRGTGEPNRYGLPATVRVDSHEQGSQVRRTRFHGLMSMLSWMLFSPVYLWLTWRWNVQKRCARTLLFLISPFMITTGYTLYHAVAGSMEETRCTDDARRYLTAGVLGIDLKVTDVGRSGLKASASGESTYVVTLDKAPTDDLLNKIAELAKRPGSGWCTFVSEAAGSTEDYGYFAEDYGTEPDSAATATPEFFRFVKDVTLKGEKAPRHVELTFNRHDTEAVLKIR